MVLVLIIGLYLVTRIVLLGNFEMLQEEEAKKNMLRVSEVITNMQENLNSASKDYASWDDTYSFAKNYNQDYIDANFSGNWSYENLGINFTIITDNKGNYCLRNSFDLKIIMEV